MNYSKNKKLDELFEYDGVWHKKDKAGNCAKFTMKDLEKIIQEVREEANKKFIKILDEASSIKMIEVAIFDESNLDAKSFDAGMEYVLRKIKSKLNL